MENNEVKTETSSKLLSEETLENLKKIKVKYSKPVIKKGPARTDINCPYFNCHR
jgi:hypothetical protein